MTIEAIIVTLLILLLITSLVIFLYKVQNYYGEDSDESN